MPRHPVEYQPFVEVGNEKSLFLKIKAVSRRHGVALCPSNNLPIPAIDYHSVSTVVLQPDRLYPTTGTISLTMFRVHINVWGHRLRMIFSRYCLMKFPDLFHLFP